MNSGRMSALVIFGATGDLAKLETFPALVGLVERGVLDVPVVGVAKSGWQLEQFRDYAAALAEAQRHRPRPSDPAKRMLDLLDYVDGDLTDDATYATLAGKLPAGPPLFYLEVPPPLFGTIAQGISTAGLATDARVMVEKPFGTDLAERAGTQRDDARAVPGGRHLPGGPLAGTRPGRQHAVHPLRQHASSSRCSTGPTSRASRSRWPRRSTSPTGVASTTAPARPATSLQNHMLQVLAMMLIDPPRGEGLGALRGPEGRHRAVPAAAVPEPTVRGQYEGYHKVDGVAPELDDRDASSPSGWPPTRGAGPACPSSSGPASACRSPRPRSACSSAPRRRTCSVSRRFGEQRAALPDLAGDGGRA